MGDPRIETARKLFEAWSSGDADAPAEYLTEDAVLHDIVGGTHEGWPAIRAFFAAGLKHWPDLVLLPDEYWTNERGVALRWVMLATVTDDRFGAETRGKKWSSDGMTWLVFENDGAGPRVSREVDYHDSGAVPKSLGLPTKR
jgi:steroid delta-isomerase-like uncharacterized protein